MVTPVSGPGAGVDAGAGWGKGVTVLRQRVNTIAKSASAAAPKRNTRFFHMLIPTFSPPAYARRRVNMHHICMNIHVPSHRWGKPAAFAQKSTAVGVYTAWMGAYPQQKGRYPHYPHSYPPKKVGKVPIFLNFSFLRWKTAVDSESYPHFVVQVIHNFSP